MWFLLIIFLLLPAIKYRTWLRNFQHTRRWVHEWSEQVDGITAVMAGCDFSRQVSSKVSKICLPLKSHESRLYGLLTIRFTETISLLRSPLLSRVTKFTQLRQHLITFINISFSRRLSERWWKRERISINLSCLKGTFNFNSVILFIFPFARLSYKLSRFIFNLSGVTQNVSSSLLCSVF